MGFFEKRRQPDPLHQSSGQAPPAGEGTTHSALPLREKPPTSRGESGSPASLLPLVLALGALLTILFATALARPWPQARPGTDEQIDLIQDRVSRLRGLAATGAVQREFMGRQALREYYRTTFFEENPIEEIETTQELLELLGYLDSGTSIIELLIDVLGEEVLGFYNRETKTVYVVSDRDELTPNDVTTLAHEIAHALQDQHYDLAMLYAERKGDNDRTLALQALVEGDATLLHSLYALRHLSEAERAAETTSSGSGALDNAPLVVRRELIFPYDEGVNFLLGPFLSGSWPAIDAIWREPPESTEQIIHPEKYRAREGPIPVELPDLAASLEGGWRQVDESNIGELDWQILIEQYTDAPTGRRAAAGWGGDRYQLLKRDADAALVFASRSVWDTETDAVEFFDAYQRVATTRHGVSLELTDTPPGADGAHAAWSARGEDLHHAIARDDATVILVISNTTDGLAVFSLLRAPEAQPAPVPLYQEALVP